MGRQYWYFISAVVQNTQRPGAVPSARWAQWSGSWGWGAGRVCPLQPADPDWSWERWKWRRVYPETPFHPEPSQKRSVKWGQNRYAWSNRTFQAINQTVFHRVQSQALILRHWSSTSSALGLFLRGTCDVTHPQVDLGLVTDSGVIGDTELPLQAGLLTVQKQSPANRSLLLLLQSIQLDLDIKHYNRHKHRPLERDRHTSAATGPSSANYEGGRVTLELFYLFYYDKTGTIVVITKYIQYILKMNMKTRFNKTNFYKKLMNS